ncbi:MAG: hypothetical protein ACXVEI_05410, partial [Actinomycetota bacterium]
MRARSFLAILLAASIVAGVPVAGRAASMRGHGTAVHHDLAPDQAVWQRRIDSLIGDRRMSVTVGDDGAFWYRHLAWVERAPASNEKLLLSMALLATVGHD